MQWSKLHLQFHSTIVDDRKIFGNFHLGTITGNFCGQLPTAEIKMAGYYVK